MKRIKIFLLTLLMAIALLPFSTYADEDTTSKQPDYTVYVDAGGLKSNEMYGSPLSKKSKILFGKDSNGNRLEWYLSGIDSSLSNPDLFDNNILIISVTPIANLQFNPNDNNSTYVYEADTGYGNTDGSIEVYANHYGNSELRKNLQSIALNTAYFSMAEQNMMISVPIVTEDNKNQTDGKNIEYTTSDKLYIPSFKINGNITYLSYGSKNGKEIELSKLDELFKTPEFFLRTPGINGQSQGIYMCARESESDYEIGTTSSDLPADSVIVVADLKADNVLFASSAETKTAKIDKNKAMTLRFEDENIDIGKVVYTTDGVIFAERGNTDKKVNLIVQGRNGGQNWSYSKTLSSDITINKSEIIEELNDKLSLNISDIDLKMCYVWLEVTGDDGMIYATESFKGIKDVEITDIDAPVVNEDLDLWAQCIKLGIIDTTHTVTWDTTDTKAGYYKAYKASITLRSFKDANYIFLDDVNATVNGNKASCMANDDGTITVTYIFPYTNDKLVSAADPDPITVKNGISLDDIAKQLPKQVSVTTVGNSVSSLDVKWIVDQGINYDPAKKEAQKITINGTVELPKDNSILPINNDEPAVVRIKVTITAAEVVLTPTPVPVSTTNSVTDDGYVVPNTGVK